MIVIATDFGIDGPYLGQMIAAIYAQNNQIPVVTLFSDLPTYDIKASAYLLEPHINFFQQGTVFLCVVDPGVGGSRLPIVVKADGRWFVGPDNGLFAMIARRAKLVSYWVISWLPDQLSASFHGRDLFAPIAAELALSGVNDKHMHAVEQVTSDPSWPEDLSEVVYADRYGNAITGIRALTLDNSDRLIVNGTEISSARTFSEVAVGELFWYENSNGLAEIAVNKGSAVAALEIELGAPVVRVLGT
ncbi:hypothetical protein BOW53_10185 [Solemya pervernicosa gill symbiont]|uniref:SAM-dependent chlorinase/fluorinase n=2 Tax=Gammaproteobacteria incertae sedis TaxID=118884 RepID=A0A1T2L420_9GAMM|nr:SAM-dependent chlorinase/fluorinase [Candidatus Reidiella endopervernicosa]OOZ39812.1 hypothetical protein BOW53_10185 [Solemya pervernicosa gill symbiont]QKQ26107.1 SAM-dependent chlorinase/fluorinase [Candidatus Reidiella endopervernicosa]